MSLKNDLIPLFEKCQTPIKDNIFLFRDFLSEDMHKQIYKELKNSSNWAYLQKSNPQKESKEVVFWINILGGYYKMADELKYNPFYEKELHEIILKNINLKIAM